MLAVPKVLLIVGDANEQAQLQKVLGPHAELTWVRDSQEATQRLDQVSYDAIFYARTCAKDGWRKMVDDVRRINSNLPVIILSEKASVVECAEALTAGAFDLLGIPYEQQLVPVMIQAVLSYEARVRCSRAG